MGEHVTYQRSQSRCGRWRHVSDPGRLKSWSHDAETGVVHSYESRQGDDRLWYQRKLTDVGHFEWMWRNAVDVESNND